MKNIILYIFFGITAIFVNALIAFLIFPTWAKCDCLYNDVKEAVLIIGPILAAGIILFLTHRLIESGMTSSKAFIKSLLRVTLLFAIINILKEVILMNFF